MKVWFKRYPYWFVYTVIVVVVSCYWAFFATDRYISETNVVLESPEITPVALNFSSLLTGGNSSKDLLLLKDYLLSVDMMQLLDSQLDLRGHYSSSNIDLISRLPNDALLEDFHEYYQSRIEVIMDDYAQILRIKVHAFTPDMAQKIAKALLREGEAHMNRMGQRLAEEQVKFIETQVDSLAGRLAMARDALLAYQNEQGLISPTSTVESISAVVAELEAQLSGKQIEKSVLLNFQSARSPDVLKLSNEIKALEAQITQERGRMAANKGNKLNKISAEYETLELQAKFALDLYSNALAALENTRVEAVRKLKQVSVLQAPTMPEFSVEPRRFHNILSFILMAALITMIIQLLDTVIREHKD
ncbi:chain-length determining protein [Neptunomonas phycophila]|uniref:chain-length determining protein n=1 Tax=Neptunomonas phycophila TaxID=1572645 RepID=UPI0015C14DE5|nr:chain-length determining protein [Neptunomonas phycophila]QLE96762.1 chain-length determining protein [Neptunomonas phycophila]